MGFLSWLLGGTSNATALSVQNGMANLSAVYNGTCDFNCQNSIKDLDITLINTTVGGDIDINQACVIDSTCTFNTSLDLVSDVYFFAKNSTNAGSPSFINPFESMNSLSESIQTIRQNINQQVSQKCSSDVLNSIQDVNIFAQNSNIGGNVVISQSGSNTGNCAMNATMTAAAYASGSATNSASSGKDLKGGGSVAIFVTIALVVVAIAAIYMLSRFWKKKEDDKAAALTTPKTTTLTAPPTQLQVEPTQIAPEVQALLISPEGANLSDDQVRALLV
jgi:hypothetical protein